jgi:hypothetical protein
LRRIETMVLMGEVALPLAAVREQVQSSLDMVVHLARRQDGSRAVVAVAEVIDRGLDPTITQSPLSTRPLADGGHVIALPERRTRRLDAPPPDPDWVEQSEHRSVARSAAPMWQGGASAEERGTVGR